MQMKFGASNCGQITTSWDLLCNASCSISHCNFHNKSRLVIIPIFTALMQTLPSSSASHWTELLKKNKKSDCLFLLVKLPQFRHRLKIFQMLKLVLNFRKHQKPWVYPAEANVCLREDLPDHCQNDNHSLDLKAGRTKQGWYDKISIM